MQIIKQCLKIFKTCYNLYPWLVIAIFATMIISELAFMSGPFIVAKIIDLAANGERGEQAYYRIGLLTILITIDQIVSYVKGTTLINKLLEKYSIDFRTMSFKKLYTLDYALINNLWTGKIQTKINQGIAANESIVRSSIYLIQAIGLRLSIVSIILLLNFPAILRFGFFAIIVSIWSYYMLRKKIEWVSESINNANEDIGRQTSLIIMENNTIRLFNKQDKELNKLQNITKQVPELIIKQSQWGDLPYYLMERIFWLCQISIYLLIWQQVSGGVFTVWWMTMLISYCRNIWRPVSEIINNMGSFTKNIAKFTQLEELLNSKQTIVDWKKKYRYQNWDIKLSNICFSYKEERSILDNLSLHIPGGRTLALVGNSGAGKSTIIRLILRLYDPGAGTIVIDSQPLQSLQLASYYEHVGYLSQEPSVFDGSILENMLYGLPSDQVMQNDMVPKVNTTNSKIIASITKSLQDAYCDFVDKLPEWLDTQIGEKWVKLSGWEKQRLAIARIFFKNPQILIFDEPTAALDSISENAITTTLHKLFQWKTVIIIAHRLQTVRQADQIIVLENGIIAQQWTHDELIKQTGIYNTLVDLQTGTLKENKADETIIP